MTSRVEGDPLDEAWRGQTRESPPVTIDLGPLRKQEALALAGGFLDAHSRFALACIERAAGNPLFLEQLLRDAEESARAEGGGGGVPGSIQSLVLARMDRLDPADRRALQAASVLGQRFAPEALRHLIDDSGYGCTGLVRHYLVRPEGEGFLFAHALIWEGVYGSLLNTRKRELHRRAAAWFAGRDPVLHAEHLDRAGDPAAPQAYLAAARAETAAYHTERALGLAERGLALARERADVGALLCFKGEVLHDRGAIPESIAAHERALELAGDDAERCRAWLGLAAGMRVTDRLDEAFAALNRAEAAATARGLLPELARVHHLRGNLYFPLGRLVECLREHERALDAARRAGSAELEARALGGVGDAEYARGRMLTAHGYFRRCVELSRAHGFGRVEVANLPMAAFTRCYANDPRGALDDALAAVRAAATVGHQRAEAIAHHGAYICRSIMAEWDAAAENVEAALALSRRLGARRFEAEALLFRAEIERAAGLRAAALAHAREALAISREAGMDFMGPWILGGLARITDDPEERRAALAEAEAMLAAGSLSHNHFWFYRHAIETALAAGDWDDVERYARALEAYTRPEPLPWTDFLITRGRALAAYGRGGCGEATVGELRRLRDEAERAGLGAMLPGLDAALNGAPAAGGVAASG
jgi:tetratricopeptide (TPR) repeat protein